MRFERNKIDSRFFTYQNGLVNRLNRMEYVLKKRFVGFEVKSYVYDSRSYIGCMRCVNATLNVKVDGVDFYIIFIDDSCDNHIKFIDIIPDKIISIVDKDWMLLRYELINSIEELINKKYEEDK